MPDSKRIIDEDNVQGDANASQPVPFPELEAFLPVERHFSGVIFDFDGTLVDSMGVWYEVDMRFCETYSMKLPDNYSEEISALGFFETAKYFKDHSDLEMTIEEIGEKFNEMAVDAYSNTVKCVPGAVKYLGILKNRGVKVAIATSVSKELLMSCIHSNGIEDMFDAFAFCDECGKNKHHSDVFELAAKRIGCKPEDCLVFEDVATAIASAKRIGMAAGAIHDPFEQRNSDLVREVADFYIHSFEPLVEAFEAL